MSLLDWILKVLPFCFGQSSSEMRHAQEIIPPDDSIPEVHAIPAFSGISESESPAPPIASPRRISISLPSPFRYSKGLV